MATTETAPAKAKSPRNYTIEFYRAMFAVNFVIVHALMVVPIGYLGGFPIFTSALDIIVPFMAFSGYFMMRGFKRQQASGEIERLGAPRAAWGYLKKRLISLMPLAFLGNFLGFIAINVWKGTPITDLPVCFLNATGEFLGLFIAGIGFGNPSVGMWGEGVRVLQCLNTPLWFISGVFVVGYLIYFLLSYNEKVFSGLIAPASIILFYGSNWQSEAAPMWYDIHSYGSLNISMGIPIMFVGLSIGVLLWYAVEALKDKKWSGGMVAFMTVVQIVLTFVVFARTWASLTSEFTAWFNLSWANVHLLSIIFSFLVLLNVDKCTRFPLFASKIWGLPGRLALYVYAIHFPIIVFVAMAMGLRGQVLSVETAATLIPQLLIMTAITLVISFVLGYLLMQFDQKKLQPWLRGERKAA